MKTPILRPLAAVLWLSVFCILHCSFFIGRATAQAVASGPVVTITGRVSDAVANTYLENAEVRVAGTNNIVYTGGDGSFSIDAPAGSVTIIVTYANSRPATRTIEAKSGKPNVLDFELHPTLAAPRVEVDEDIVQLERFTVTDERIGQAKVIMEQRAADNAKTIISTDQFGELTQGSVGEFMKYMPGVTLDLDDEGENAFVRVGGLDPKYAGFSMDGITLASATEGQSRANHFNQMSITAIESIEFNQTLLARMPANTPAGKFELKTRYAFNRKKPEITFDLGFDGTKDTIELGRAYMPDNRKHMRTYLGGRIGYGGAFFNRRLGIEASISSYQNYRNDQRHEIQYTYLVPDAELNPGTNFVERNGKLEAEEGPSIRRLSWLDGPRIKTSQSANLSIDYKITPYLVFAIRSQYTYSENEYYNIYYRLLAENRDEGFVTNLYSPTSGLDPSSTLTRWVVNPVGAGGSQSFETVLTEGASFRVVKSNNYYVSPRLNYKKGPLEIELRTAYSYSRGDYSDGEENRFRGAPNRLSGLGWIAERPSTDSPTWTLTQTAGSLWTEPQNFSRSVTYLMGVYYDDPHYNENTQGSAYLDLTYAARIFSHPVTLRTGGSILDSDYTRRRQQENYNYIGPEGRQMSAIFPFADNYVFNVDLGGNSGNINEQNWPVVDQGKLWTIFQEHPEWFTVDAVDNTRNAIVNRSDLTERIEAYYAEATTRAGRFQFNLGARVERTIADVMYTMMRSQQEMELAAQLGSPEDVASGKFNTSTVEGVKFQYYYGERGTRNVDYSNLFLSGGLKYDFTKSLRFQLSFSQAILRPDYGNLAGTVNYPAYYPTSLWVPNPKLKPEETTKYFASIQWYLKPAGIIELSAYRLDIDGLQIKNQQITGAEVEAQLGYSLDQMMKDWAASELILDEDTEEYIEVYMERNPVTYRSTVNAKGIRTVYGITLRYDHQLRFLPGMLKGLSIFGSFTTASLVNAEIDEEKIGRASKSANGGIKYRYGRFNAQLRGTWTDDRLKSITRPYPDQQWVLNDYLYEKARFTIDLSGGWRINKNLELVFSIRNLTAEPIIWYSNVSNRLCRYSSPDTIWNLSVRGKY